MPRVTTTWRARSEWTDGLPPPPPLVYGLIERARAVNLWVSWARYAYHARKQGGRYRLTTPGERCIVRVSDDLGDIEAEIAARERAAMGA